MTKFILPAIIVLGLLLRILFVNSNPPSLYGDELTIGLDAYSLLKTGHDQLGNFMPLTFPMGAGRPAGYVYASIPFIAIFGPSAFGVRALSILSGIGIILLVYLLGSLLIDKKVGLVGALLVAISPWGISLSRGGFEANFALFLSLIGIYTFLYARNKPWFYIVSALSFSFTIHTYPTYKLTLLFILSLLIWFTGIRYLASKSSKFYLASFFLILILSLVLALNQTLTAGSEKRFEEINIFADKNLEDKIIQQVNLDRKVDSLPKFLKTILLNRYLTYGTMMLENYLNNFSAHFLLLYGDGNPRHNMTNMGNLYISQLTLVFIGLYFLLKNQNKKTGLFLFFWLLIAPFPTIFLSGPHGLRSSFMLPPLTILSAVGLVLLLSHIKSAMIKMLFLLVVGTLLIQFLFMLHNLFFLSPNKFSNFWAYPAKQATELVLANKGKYDYIFLTDRLDNIEFAYPLYARLDPVFIQQSKAKMVKVGKYDFRKFDNVYIGHIPDSAAWEFIESIEGSILYIGPAKDKVFLNSYRTVNGKDSFESLAIAEHH